MILFLPCPIGGISLSSSSRLLDNDGIVVAVVVVVVAAAGAPAPERLLHLRVPTDGTRGCCCALEVEEAFVTRFAYGFATGLPMVRLKKNGKMRSERTKIKRHDIHILWSGRPLFKNLPNENHYVYQYQRDLRPLSSIFMPSLGVPPVHSKLLQASNMRTDTNTSLDLHNEPKRRRYPFV